MVEAKRKRGESFEAFLRRFNKRLMQSGTLMHVKKHRYHKPSSSRNLQKQSALLVKERQEKREYLKKTGKLVEEKPKRRGGRR